MIRKHLSLTYRILSVLVIAFILLSFDYTFTQALFVAVLFLPAAFFLEWNWERLSVKGKDNVFRTVCFALGLYLSQTLLFIHANYMLFSYYSMASPPALLFNPAFVWLVLAILVIPIKLFKNKNEPITDNCDRIIEFTSDRRIVNLRVGLILYIESNDDVVLIHTTTDTVYRSKTNISHWNRELQSDIFIRTHRSFIVNVTCIESVGSTYLMVQGEEIPISRSYKEEVSQRLSLMKLP